MSIITLDDLSIKHHFGDNEYIKETKIDAGAECKPHTDTGGWHADYYEKFAIQIASAPGQKFCFENVEFESKPGDVYWFNNSFKHWVPNPTPYERITMIVCVKR